MNPNYRFSAEMGWEPFIAIWMTSVVIWFSYKFLLRKVSAERHRIFKEHFQNLSVHLTIGTVVFCCYQFTEWIVQNWASSEKILSYFGFVTVFWGCVIIVKILRIISYQLLFLTNMKAGVPLLLVNVLTLFFYFIVGTLALTKYFDINLTPLLATSAVLSIVLGLALQDTLGNLFAGIALQIDKPFELGDWIEAKNGSERLAGQILEVSWRATVLLAITDEVITIPNRTLAQLQISNFAGRNRPFIRGHIFRVPFDADITKVKSLLIEAAKSTPSILSYPSPAVIILETTESWVTLKAVYSLDDYGIQYGVADQFMTEALGKLKVAKIDLATPRMSIEKVG